MAHPDLASTPVSYVLRHANVLGPTGAFTGPLDVQVSNGIVEAVAPHLPAHDDIGPSIDFSGLFVMPGVFDCHLHAGVPSYDALELLHTPFSRRTLETAQVLRRTLESGVTTVRDAGGLDAGVRDGVAAGFVPGPRLQVSVVALGPTGGHGDGFLEGPGIECSVDYMQPDYPGRPPSRVDGVEEMRKAVRLVLRAGADWIKLIATRGVLSASGGGFDEELDLDEIAVAVAEAARRGRSVMVHALGGPAIGHAVAAGARSIEHGVFLSEADAQRMAASGCSLVPTLVIYDKLAQLAHGGSLQGERQIRARAVGDVLGEAVAIARAAGVSIAVGSDFAHRADHGNNLAELPLLRAAGLSAEEVLLAATWNGAVLCGVNDRFGRIAAGYVFDAIVLEQDPADLEVFASPGAVTGVWKGGVPVVDHPRFCALG